MVWPGLEDDPSFIPSFGIVPVLILDVNMVTRDQWMQFPGALCHLFLCPGSGLSQGFLPGFGGESPLLLGEELAWLEGERVPHLPSEDYLGWAKARVRARSISMHEDSPDKFVSVQGACLGHVAPNDPLGMLYAKFSPFVGLRIIGRGDSVNDPPSLAESLEQFRCEDFAPSVVIVTGIPNMVMYCRR